MILPLSFMWATDNNLVLKFISGWVVVTHALSSSTWEAKGRQINDILLLPSKCLCLSSAGTSGWGRGRGEMSLLPLVEKWHKNSKALSHLKKSCCGVTVGCRLGLLLFLSSNSQSYRQQPHQADWQTESLDNPSYHPAQRMLWWCKHLSPSGYTL